METHPDIDGAQRDLQKALDEACGVDLRTADTGELIRVEEALQLASQRAKEAVSLRLKARSDRRATASGEVAKQLVDERSEAGDRRHRVFNDKTGVSWAVFAVHPSARTIEGGTLPPNFAEGWLSFEHGDEVRRFAPVPHNWESLTDNQLCRLWEQAELSTKRITTIQTAAEKLNDKR